MFGHGATNRKRVAPSRSHTPSRFGLIILTFALAAFLITVMCTSQIVMHECSHLYPIVMLHFLPSESQSGRTQSDHTRVPYSAQMVYHRGSGDSVELPIGPGEHPAASIAQKITPGQNTGAIAGGHFSFGTGSSLLVKDSSDRVQDRLQRKISHPSPLNYSRR